MMPTRAPHADSCAPFLSPAGGLLGAITLAPALYVLWLSLQHRGTLAAIAGFAGFSNYARLLGDERFWNASLNTIYFTGVSVTAELALGLAVALLVHGAARGRPLLYALVLLPWAVPTVVSARMWEWMYNADFGVINHVLGARINWLGSPAWAMHAAILMDVWKSTPFVAVLLIAGLQAIPRELHHAAALDGAGRLATFARVTLPLLRPALLVALVFRTIDAFRVFDAVYVLTGGGPANRTETLSIYAYKTTFQSLDFGYGAALSVSVLLAIALLTALYARLLGGGRS